MILFKYLLSVNYEKKREEKQRFRNKYNVIK